MIFNEKIKQEIVNLYNHLEPWITGVVFLVFGIWVSNIYQSANMINIEDGGNGFFDWVRYVDKFQILLAFVIFVLLLLGAYKIKKLSISKEKESRDSKDKENEELRQSLDELKEP